MTDGIGAPDPDPKHLVSFVSNLIWVILHFLNWLSGALVGVGGSDFIGYVKNCFAHTGICEKGTPREEDAWQERLREYRSGGWG